MTKKQEDEAYRLLEKEGEAGRCCAGWRINWARWRINKLVKRMSLYRQKEIQEGLLPHHKIYDNPTAGDGKAYRKLHKEYEFWASAEDYFIYWYIPQWPK